MKIKIEKLILKNFKGIKDFILNTNGENVSVLGDNGTGKTTIFDAFLWLLFNKDSQDKKDFNIKTLDESGEPLHGLEHSVTGVLDVDGRKITLQKIFKEKWTKKHGEAEKQLTGHETLFYVNEVPQKQGEYSEYINSLVDENLFKLLSNPLYFSTNLKWQDRRKALIDIIGDIDNERIMNYKPDLRAIEGLLNEDDIDNIRKRIASRKKKLNDDIKSIPARIDECKMRMKEDIDFKDLENQKNKIMADIASIDEQIADSSKADNAILDKKKKLFDLKSKLQDLQFKIRQDSQKPLMELKTKLSEIDRNISTTKFDKANNIASLAQINIKTSTLMKQIEKLRNDWGIESDKELTFDENKFVCPTCHRPFDEEDINSKKAEMLENFNENKANKLQSIAKQGQDAKKELERLQSDIPELTEKGDKLTEEFLKLQQEKTDIEGKINAFNTPGNVAYTPEEASLRTEIEKLEAEISKPQSENDTLKELKDRKAQLNSDLVEINDDLSYQKTNKEFQARINELLLEEKKLAQQIADLEKQEYYTDEFIKTKVELLESSINNKFKYVSFKLFNTQINGALDECCEAMIEGVPYSDANSAGRINAGLDIINTLSEHYKVNVPCFLDNAESIRNILPIGTQLIKLIVPPSFDALDYETKIMWIQKYGTYNAAREAYEKFNKELRIENNSEKVAA